MAAGHRTPAVPGHFRVEYSFRAQVAGAGFRMARTQRTQDGPLVRRTRAPVPHEFVLDALGALDPLTRPMFGCLAVYVGERIVMVLRDRQRSPADNGIMSRTQRHPATP